MKIAFVPLVPMSVRYRPVEPSQRVSRGLASDVALRIVADEQRHNLFLVTGRFLPGAAG